MARAWRTRRGETRPASEVAAVGLLLLFVLYVAGNVAGEFSPGRSLGGVWSLILRLTYWAQEPTLPFILVMSALLALHQITVTSNAIASLDYADDVQAVEPPVEDPRANALWDRAGHAHVIALLATLCGLLVAVGAVLYVVSIERVIPAGLSQRIGLILLGLGEVIGGMAAAVIGKRSHTVWLAIGFQEAVLEEDQTTQ